MVQGRKHIIIVIYIITIIGVIITIYFFQYSRPQYVIERGLMLKLPSSSKILNYDYDGNGGYFDAKIVIDNQNVSNIRNQLIAFFGEEAQVKDMEVMPNFKNVCSWWDLDKNSIEVCYNTVVSGEKKLFGSSPKSRDVWAFITKDKDGRYYLYISY